jgi:hypothetical protein
VEASDGRVIVIDSENIIHLVDPGLPATLKTLSGQFKPAQMCWLIPDLQVKVAGARGKIIGMIKLPQQDFSQEKEERRAK